MKNLVIALVLSSTAVFASVGCGDSTSTSKDNKGGAGGASGASGSNTGGTTTTGGSAGTPATGGASGTATTGGSAGTPATGGASGTATTGGTAGAAGAEGGVGAEGGNGDGGMGTGGDGTGPGDGCPMSQPMPMTACGTRGLSCDFGDTVCRCNLNTGNWQCLNENGNCPAMRNPGGNCMGGMTACSYGSAGTCVCMGGNFTCDAGVVSCPAMQPMDGGGCNMFPAGFDCSYSAGNCTCMAAGGAGMRTWNCQDSACPAMTPMGNSACPTPGLICDYTTPGPAPDPTCVCNTMSRWTCL